MQYHGQIIPFDAAIKYYPVSEIQKRKQHTLNCQLRGGLFVGYATKIGGEWSGFYLIIDTIQLQQSTHAHEATIRVVCGKELSVVMSEVPGG